ncbi:MAG: DMT family transporter [Albidovulum sp.]
MPVSRPMNAQEWALLVALSVIWGGSFFFIAVAVKALPPITIVFLRVAIGAAALLVVLKLMRQSVPLHRAAIITFIGMGLLNNLIPQGLIVWALGSIASGYASILNAMTPFFTVLIFHYATEDRVSPSRMVGVLIAFAGVATMIGLDLIANSQGNLLPQLAILAASFSYGLSNLWGRRLSTLKIAPLPAATGQLCASTAQTLPHALVFERPHAIPMPDSTVWAAILGLALICTALAYLIFFRIMATAGGSNLSLVTFLIPVSAIILGIAFLGEQLHLRHVAGMAMIGIGLVCIDGRLLLRSGLISTTRS